MYVFVILSVPSLDYISFSYSSAMTTNLNSLFLFSCLTSYLCYIFMYFKETLKFICDFHPLVKKIEKHQACGENTHNNIIFPRIFDYMVLVPCDPNLLHQSSLGKSVSKN